MGTLKSALAGGSSCLAMMLGLAIPSHANAQAAVPKQDKAAPVVSAPSQPVVDAAVAPSPAAPQAAAPQSAADPAPPPAPPPASRTTAEGATTEDQSDIIVTGSARQQRRFDVSYAVNSFSQNEVKKAAPLNMADLVGKLPGIQAESTGGEVANVTRVRGIPTDDGYLLFQQDGLPLYQDILGASFKGDTLNRYDLMTDRLEVVRGGPAPIYGSQAAAIANAITVTGSDTAKGKVQVTAGTTDLYRLDAVQSGPLGSNTYYAVGGFLRRDGGQRDNGFTNDRGGQIRANLKHDFSNGSVKVTGLYLDDHNGFYLPIPIADPRNPAVSLDPYIDYFHGTMNTPALRDVNIKFLNGAGVLQNRSRDLANGRHTRLGNVGLQYNGEFGGWEFVAKGGYSKGRMNFDGLYSTSNPVDATTFANSYLTPSRAAFGAGVTRIGYAIAGTNGATPYNPAADSGLVVQGQYRAVDVRFYSGQGDLSVTKKFETQNGSHDLKIGVYGASYGVNVNTSYQDYLFQVKGKPATLDLLAYSATGAVLGSVTDKGVLRYATTLIGGDVDTTMYAFYVNDTWEITEGLRADAGVRHERYSYDGFSRVTGAANLGDPTTLADDATRRYTGAIQQYNTSIHTTSMTAGLNYDFSSNFGAYVRASRLEAPPSAALFTQINPVILKTKADQFEAGVKASFGRSYLYLTGFYTKFDPFNASFIAFNPATGRNDQAVPFFGKVIVKGLEADGALQLSRWFSLAGAVTVQDPYYSNLTNTTGADPSQVAGNQIIREPKVFGNIRPTISYDFGDNRIELYGSYEYVGKRYTDFFNATALPSYGSFDAGITLTHGTFQFQVVGDNITNAHGLTEGNTRTDTLAGQGTSEAIYGRPIFGRSVRFVLSKSW